MLHVDHALSVYDAEQLGISPAVYNSKENLIATCGECNAGKGKTSINPVLYFALVHARSLHDA